MQNRQSTTQATVYDKVLTKVEEFRSNGELSLPANYSPGNALKSAQLVISEVVDRNKKPAMEVCTKNSIAQALLDTVLQGLNPGKKQCYYIVYGDKLVMQRSYFGEMHVAMSVCPEIEGIYPEVVYEGDVFEYSKKRGKTVVTSHIQRLENVNSGRIIAAYCTVAYRDGSENTTVMTLAEIHAAWRMSRQSPFDDAGGLKASSTHGRFPAEMAKKTVVRKACKTVINASDDSNLVLESIQRTGDAASDAETDELINEHNGAGEMDINDVDSNGTYEVDTDTGEVLGEAAPY